MKVILMDDVVGLGDIGQTVTVKPGYARNFLIPRRLAAECGTASARMIAHQMRQIEAKKKRMRQNAEGEAARLGETVVTLSLRVGSGGRVFGSIGARDIAEALAKMGTEVDRRRIQLAEPIRKIGRHNVDLKLHADVHATIVVEILEAQATKEEEEKEAELARQRLEEKKAERVSQQETEAGAAQ